MVFSLDICLSMWQLFWVKVIKPYQTHAAKYMMDPFDSCHGVRSSRLGPNLFGCFMFNTVFPRKSTLSLNVIMDPSKNPTS